MTNTTLQPFARTVRLTSCLLLSLAVVLPDFAHAGVLSSAARSAIAARTAQAAALRAGAATTTKQYATASVSRQLARPAIVPPPSTHAIQMAQAPARVATVPTRPKDVLISRSRHPQAAAHIDHAQRHQPTILHIDRKGAPERRYASIGRIDPTRKPFKLADRDEYPPAFTREGGHNANTRWISRSDNRGAGASMRAQTRDLPDGAAIRVLVTD